MARALLLAGLILCFPCFPCIGQFALVTAIAHAGDAPAVDPGAQRAIEQVLAHGEYRVTANADGVLTAPNRAQNLRVTFGVDGVTVRPREGDASAFAWGLRFVGFGRERNLAPHRAAPPQLHGNRVECARGAITE